VSGIDDHLREELGALLDGVLPEDRARELRLRLEEDAALRQEYEELARTVAAVRALPRAGAPDALRRRVDAALAGGGGTVHRFRWLAVAAALLVAVAGAFLAFGPAGTRTAPEQTGQARQKPAARKEKPGVREREQPPTAPSSVGALAESKAQSGGAAAGDEAQGAGGDRLEKAEVGAVEGRGATKEAPGPAKSLNEVTDLLATVARTGTLPATERAAYLARVEKLSSTELVSYVRGFAPAGLRLETPRDALEEKDAGATAAGAEAEGSAEALGAAAAPALRELVAVQLKDRREAELVNRVLRPFTVAGEGLTVEYASQATREVATVVEATPADLDRIAAWLRLLDMGAQAKKAEELRRVTFGAEDRVQGAKEGKSAPPPAKEKARVILRYGPPPSPEPQPAEEPRPAREDGKK